MNKQLRRNRAGETVTNRFPSIIHRIKKGDLDDERRKLNMPTQFRITTDTSIFSTPVLGSGCFRHSAVMCTAPGFAPSTRQALDHTILRHCVAKRQKRNGRGGRIQGDSRKTHLWYGVGKQLTKMTSFMGANAASWNRRIGRVWPPVITHNPGVYLQSPSTTGGEAMWSIPGAHAPG